jgi:hypothetical protein
MQAEAKAARGSTSSAEKFRWSAREYFFNSIGTKWTCRLSRAQSALRGSAENICSQRAFPVLTHPDIRWLNAGGCRARPVSR